MDEPVEDPEKNEKPVKAWDEDEPEKIRTFKSSYEIIQDYSEYSTIQGLIYIFFAYQTVFGKIFWIIVIILMVILGLYWIIKAYLDWQEKPVLTTVTTTAYAVKQVDFPAVTICSPGMSFDLLIAGFFKLMFSYMQQNKTPVNISPIDAATVLYGNNLTSAQEKLYNNVTALLQSSAYASFINTTFHGLTSYDYFEDIIDLLKLMTSRNPDADIASMVALDGGFDPCANSTSTPAGKRKKRQATDSVTCDSGYVLDSTTNYCYQIFSSGNDFYDALDACGAIGADLLAFENDAQVSGILTLLNKGSLSIPADLEKTFWIYAYRDDNLDFGFNSYPINATFTKLTVQNDTKTESCLKGKFVSGSTTLSSFETTCMAYVGVICRKFANVQTSCSGPSTFKKANPLNLVLDPSLQALNKQSKAQKTQFFKNMFLKLDQTKAFKGLFSTLWYATLPCFDIKGVSAYKDGDKSILKYCEWKGVPVPCSEIFTAFPTDQGICCAFNIRAANEIFKGNTFPNQVKELQDSDKNNSLNVGSLPKKYKENKEPRTLPGRNKGLVIMVDMHTDLLGPGSIDTDYKGFFGLVSPSGSFPFTTQEGFEIRPGHNNLIALTGTKIDADNDLRTLVKDDRKCLFPDENSDMKIHKNFTYSNCMFECALLYAKKQLQEKNNANYSCIPWYFPSADDSITVCDPWETVDFLNFTLNEIPDETCAYCLADCQTTIYETSITTIPFRRCDIYNIGVSRLCNLEDNMLPTPKKYGSQVLAEFPQKPAFLNRMQPTQRTYAEAITDGDTFTRNPKTYEAYDEDIAIVQIYFKKSSVFQMGSQPRMTWIDYFSNVGGLLGLVLGMGIVSFVELIWLCLRLGARKMNLTNWIR